MHPLKLLPLILLIATPCFAWNVTSHEVVASIGYDVLVKEHPKTLAKVLAILRQHPLKEMIAKQLDYANAPKGSEDKALFIVAARWPDDVRMKAGIKGYSHPTWHYVDFPLSTKGDPTTGPQPEMPNALSSLDGQIGVLKGNNPATDKAVAVCWIEHLVGDLHQPLHAVSLYTKELPKGDRGGNETFVRFEAGKKTINLHSVWDGLLGQDSKFTPATRIAAELMARPDFAKAKLPEINELDAAKWAKESFEVARRVAYINSTLHGGEEKNGVVLPPDYGKTSKAVAERQVVIAGYRLAAVLVQAVGD